MLGRTAKLALMLGGAGSVALLLYAGRRNPSLLLTLLMALWVLAPFAIVGVALWRSRRWPTAVATAVARVSVGLALASFALYAIDALRPFSAKAAFMFVLVPPVSGVVAVAVCALSLLWARRGAGL